jgi:Zn-dependent peptidase ImmA (M78 family)
MKWKELKSRLPHRVQVGPGVYYDVFFATEIEYPSEVVGLTTYDKQHIVVKSKQSNRQTVLTTFHEFLHAISGTNGADLTETQVIQLEESFPYFYKFFEALIKR